MIHARRTATTFILWSVLAISTGMAQPKWTFHIGSGFYQPSLGYLDPDSNSVIPSLSAFGKNILIDWGMKYQFYPNARVGYSRSNSFANIISGTVDILIISQPQERYIILSAFVLNLGPSIVITVPPL